MGSRDVTASRDVGPRAERAVERLTGTSDETRDAFFTSEFWAMVGVIAGVLISCAVLDNLDAPRAWLITAIVATGYMVSRGLAKSAVRHELDRRGR